ncbi:MAG: GTP-binding protein [archaeon]|nr:GTP-binding protein [archaeon]
MPATIGGIFTKKLVEYYDYNLTLDMELWDTAGEERYRAANTLYYRDAHIAVLVYDITNKSTYEEITKYWLPQVKENSPENTIIIICGNKSDLYEYEDVDSEEVTTFCEDNNVKFYLVSAKTGSGINVRKYLFYLIGNVL